MTDPLETLRPEVRDALEKLEYFLTGTHNHNDFYALRAELLRLAMIESDALIALDCEHDWQVEHERAEKAEAELEALRARIAEAPIVECPLDKPTTEREWLQVIEWAKGVKWTKGKRVRLLVED